MKLKCDKCSYEWNYKGKMKKATCPSCQYKVVVTKSTGKRAATPNR